MTPLREAILCAIALCAACARPSGGLPAGSYRCQTITAEDRYQPSALGTIAIDGTRYASGEGEGTYDVSGHVVAFRGGPLDGWRAALGKSEAGVYLRFRGSSTGAPGDQRRPGDHLCFVAR